MAKSLNKESRTDSLFLSNMWVPTFSLWNRQSLSNMYFLSVEPPVSFLQICTYFSLWNRQSLSVKYVPTFSLWNRQSRFVKYVLFPSGTASLFLSNMDFLSVEPPVSFCQICTFSMWNRQSLSVKYVLSPCGLSVKYRYVLSLCGTASLFLSNMYFLCVESPVSFCQICTFSVWNR